MNSIILYCAIITFLLYAIGAGTTALLIPSSLRKYSLWIAPWIGVILIASGGIYASALGIPMKQAVYIILAVGMSLGGVAIARKRLVINSPNKWLICVLMLSTLIFNLYPLLVRERFSTTISMGNLDPLSYTTVADFFSDNTIHDGQVYKPFSPYIWSIGDLVHHSYRWGSPMVLSFFSTLFSVRSYTIFTILINILFVLSLPLMWVLAKMIYPFIRIGIFFLLWAMYGINSTLLYMLYNVFFAQFMFSGLILLSFILGVELSRNIGSSKSKLNTEILLALILSGVSSIYPEGLSFVILPFGVYVVLRIIITRSWRPIAKLRVLLLAAMFNPYTMYRGIEQLVKVAISSSHLTWIGWEPIRYASLIEILGLYNLHYSRPLPLIAALVTGIGISLIMILGFLKCRQRLFILANLIVFILIYVSTRYLGHNYYTYHRALTYTLFIYVVVFTIGAEIVFNKINRPYVKSIVIVTIILLSTRSAVRTLQQFYWHHQSVDKALISLEWMPSFMIAEPFYTDDIVVGEHNLWRRLWQEYMLKDHSLVSRQNYPTDFTKTVDISHILSAKDTIRENQDRLDYEVVIWENEFYMLGTLRKLNVDQSLNGEI